METDSMSPSGDVDVALSARLVSIYTALQKLDSDSSQEYFAHISTASRQYRSVIQEKISETNDASLLVLNELWDLFEIIIIDAELTGIKKGQTLEDLLLWCGRHNKTPLHLQENALNSNEGFTNPLFYDAVSGYLLQGNLGAASDLLRLHPEFEYNSNSPISQIDQLVVRKPVFADFIDAPFSDFEQAFEQWQVQVQELISQGVIDLNPNLEKIAGILIGDEVTIDGCLQLCGGQWYRLLLAKWYYSCPSIDTRTMIHSSASSSTIENTILADLINRIFELEKGQALRDLVTLSNCWRWSAHLADLLCKGDQENEEILKLRNHFILNYAKELLENEETFMIGLKYLLTLPNDEEIENLIADAIKTASISDNESAERLYALPRQLNLPHANFLRKQIATSAANYFLEDSQSLALCWAIRASNDEICSAIADSILKTFHESDTWNMPYILESLGDASVFSEKLIFLYKYKQFHSKVRDEKTFEAAEDLISILSSNMSTGTLSLVLAQALVLLDQNFTFSRNHIICIMRALQTQSQKCSMLSEAEVEQANLLRKSLANHLTRSIIRVKN